jgi:hypothetical protein
VIFARIAAFDADVRIEDVVIHGTVVPDDTAG